MSKIRIHSHLFIISDPYQEGYQISDAEAKALNSLRAENVRNNMAKEYAKLGPVPSPEEMEEFAQQVALYDASYRFYGKRKSIEVQGIFERELEVVAKEKAQAIVEPDSWQEFLALPEVQAEARRRLELQRQISQEVLDELSAAD